MSLKPKIVGEVVGLWTESASLGSLSGWLGCWSGPGLVFPLEESVDWLCSCFHSVSVLFDTCFEHLSISVDKGQNLVGGGPFQVFFHSVLEKVAVLWFNLVL